MRRLLLPIAVAIATTWPCQAQLTYWQMPGPITGTMTPDKANEELIWLITPPAPGVRTSGILLRVAKPDTDFTTNVSIYNDAGQVVLSTAMQPFPKTGYIFLAWTQGTTTVFVGPGSSRYHLGIASTGNVIQFGSVSEPSPECDAPAGTILDGVSLTSISIPPDYWTEDCNSQPWFTLE